MRPSRLDDVREVAEDALASGGVHAVLAFLNRRAPHRFTGVYRVDGSVLRSLYLFDEENPALELGSDAPLRETYCSITAGASEPFATADTRADARLEAHPARETTLSYCGVPLIDEHGTTLGTLCHFDLVPRGIPVEEIEVLVTAAPMVLEALLAEGAFPPAD